MCSFLTVGVERKRSGSLETALLALRLEMSREINPQVGALFPKDDVLFLITRGGCSCDLVPLKAGSAREEKRRRRGQAGSKRPNQLSDDFFASLRAHAPVRLFFHEVAGDQLSDPVPEGACTTLIG